VHGKNHHRDGTFGRFVEAFRIIRSTGETLACSPAQNTGLFAATIGGLGLTGLITELEVRLIPIQSTHLNVRFELFNGLQEFAQLSAQYQTEYRYTVAWLDCATAGKNLARGVFMAANHATQGSLTAERLLSRVNIPTAVPEWLLNRYTVRAFNSAYYHRHRLLDGRVASRSYPAFFYPLDAIDRWNNMYGRRGFHQYQFVVPAGAEAVLEVMLKQVIASGLGSCLAVLKEFGHVESPGMLSFPRPGLCLALDFINSGNRTTALINNLDAQVTEAGGAAYPAKDRLMSAASFRQYFPRHTEFSRWVDPGFSSDFWRRVSG
jgi:FAD/FMN-containing dehydrogenase